MSTMLLGPLPQDSEVDHALGTEHSWENDSVTKTPGLKVVALVPAYNEDKYIGSVVVKARSFVDQVVVINDGSSDQSGRVAAGAGAIVLDHATNRGKGAAIRTGLEWAIAADAMAVILLDGDGQHSPDDIQMVVAPVLAGVADMVVGSRFVGEHARKNIPKWRVMGQRALNMATTLGSNHSLTDSQSGFRSFSRRGMHLMYAGLRSEGFAVESEMQFIAQEHGLSTLEIPIIVDYDVPLKRSPVAHGLEVLNGLLKTVGQARPLLFISLPGLVLLLVGMLFGLSVVNAYSDLRELAVGQSLLTVLFLVVGVLALFVGIMLHTMRAFFLQFSPRR